MKKILLVLLLSVVFNQLKAQKIWTTESPIKAPDNLFHNYFKPAESPAFVLPKIDAPLIQAKSVLPVQANQVVSTMPIVKTNGNDKIPIVKLGDPNTKYTMLVKKITVINPDDQPQDQNP